MVRYIEGDILSEPKQGERIIICQQVNCAGVIGAGLAKQIRAKYPVVYSEYQQYIYELTAQESPLLGRVSYVRVADNIAIANIFGQDGYGRGMRHTNYAALSVAFWRMFSRIHNTTIRIPYGIGCGLGVGDWNIVEALIKDAAEANNADAKIWRKL